MEVTNNAKCPKCGKAIEYRHIPLLDKTVPIVCQCVAREREQERQQCIAAGNEIIRKAIREQCGMKARQREYTLAEISPLNGQMKAYSSVCSFVERYAADPRTKGLLMSGGVGSGKTMFAAAAANAVIDAYSADEETAERIGRGESVHGFGAPVRFVSVVELLEQLRATYNTTDSQLESAQRITDKLKKCRLLVLDDMGAEKASEWASERLFETIDYRYNENLPIVITTNATPDELKRKIGERSYDRLREMCIYAPVTVASQRATAKGPTSGNS